MRFLTSLILGVFALTNVVAAKNLPPPYDTVEILPFDNHGFFVNHAELKELISKNNVTTVIEVGSWLGLSTRFIASKLPPGGKVIAVDHWLGSEEHQPGNTFYNPKLSVLYQQFLSNVIHARLTDKIIPVRMSSLEAASTLYSDNSPLTQDIVARIPDLIYLDASHDTESVYADLNAWYPLVQGHGILCGDDWTWKTVRAAVIAFAEEQNLEITSTFNFWWLSEKQE